MVKIIKYTGRNATVTQGLEKIIEKTCIWLYIHIHVYIKYK